MNSNQRYYVYAYYDPTNYEIFYIGKGKGKRKLSHLHNKDLSKEKVKRIKAIETKGETPVIRVIAKDLTQDEAFLVEKSLIWAFKVEHLTNIYTGAFSNKFRPDYSLHEELVGFDFTTGVYYVNVAEGNHRNWDDCRKYEFLCAGGDLKWSDPLKRLEKGDIVVAYLKSFGYVGIGRITGKHQKAIDFITKTGKKLIELKDKLTEPNIFDNFNSDAEAQYVVGVKWIKAIDRDKAKWKKNSGLFTSQLVVASLLNQAKTIDFLEKEFDLKFDDYIK